MPTLTSAQVEDARKVLAALQAALDKVGTGAGLGSINLPSVVTVEVAVSDVPASASVAEACAASRRARTAFEAETEARRVAAIVIAVLAEVGKVALGPAIGLLAKL
jgi:vacuolar-type H+-ATPase subunit E/Vma4